ncbi:hypothetical protein LTR64_004306 [Lithohypha guttulata]|uniref:uncharacterized protein n=1 Tax=Lithohypha guttulata TaxID=1690604 RepID=UPI002DE00F42|nr:hypothetical protein LTR51_006400 [Lithohypha guttulata]
MATVSTPVRQPFGIVNETKLRNLQSIKNRQNALTPNSAPSLKRRAASPELSDSENIDPSHFESSIKRKRAAIEDDVSLAKQPRLLTTKVIPTAYTTTKFSTPPTTVSRPENLFHPSTQAPLSAPAAAGRSPTRVSNRSKLDKSAPRRRFAPPSIKAAPTLSVAAALRGTLAHKKPSSSRSRRSTGPTLGESKPQSWFFDIYEEPEDQQDYRMCEWTMTQSSAALDISDDEGKPGKSSDKHNGEDRGKENVDPNEMATPPVPVTRPSSATAAAVTAEQDGDKMAAEEPRTPLGDLNASEFYGEGLNATSVVLVHEDVPADEVDSQAEAQDTELTTPEQSSEPPLVAAVAEDFTFTSQHEPRINAEPEVMPEDIPDWVQRTSLTFDILNDQDDTAKLMPSADTGDIEIWESESAKDENEHQQQEDEEQYSNRVVIGAGQTISLSRTCLQEMA